MENQISNTLGNRFRKLVGSSLGFLSTKHRKFKIHQVETRKILARIMEIKKNRPELSRYLDEMPEFPPHENDPEIRLADLRGYHIRLLDLLEKYELESSKGYLFI